MSFELYMFSLNCLQVATFIATAYFIALLFSKQFLPQENEESNSLFTNATLSYSNKKPFNDFTPDVYVPLFTFVEFLCIMGWIKVSETMLNPFGDDDVDINVTYLINRNLQVVADRNYKHFPI